MDEGWVINKIRGLERRIKELEARIAELERDKVVLAIGKPQTF